MKFTRRSSDISILEMDFSDIKNDIEKSSFFYNELLNSTSETNNKMYEKTMIIFLNYLLQIMKTKRESTNEVEKIISIFNFLNMPLKAKQCSLLHETVKSNNLTSSVNNS